MSAAPFTIRLLGSFEAFAGSERLPALRTRKGSWLLALLILKHPRPVHRDFLVEALWPDAQSADGGFDSLRKCLHDLRRALGAQAHRLYAPDARSLALDLDGAQVDIIEFDRASSKTDRASLQAASDLYRGCLLEGCSEQWVYEERASLQERYVAVLERLARLMSAQGDERQAIEHLRRATAVAPLSETATRALMQSLARTGDVAQAVSTYQVLWANLRKELGAQPSAQTKDLFAGLSSNSALRSSTPAAGRALRRWATNLPDESRPLVGRSSEAKELIGLITGKSSRLVTVTGIPGIGKTRLAIHVSNQAMSHFVDGAYLIDMTRAGDTSGFHALLGTLLHTTGADQALAAAQAIAQRKMLIVVDCTDLPANLAQVLDHLAKSCPNLTVLTACRQRLGVPGERIVQLGPLALQPSNEGGISDSTELFVQAAGSVLAEFSPTRVDIAQIDLICRGLDGLPLSIIVSAGWLRFVPLKELRRRVEQDRLGAIGLAGAGHHGSISELMAPTLTRLTSADRSLLLQLGFFEGGCFLEGASAVCAATPESDLLAAIGRLGDLSLLSTQKSAGQARISLLQAVQDCLKETEFPESREPQNRDARRAFVSFCLALSRNVQELMRDGRWAQGSALLWREVKNIRAALRWCVELRNDEAVIQLFEILGRQYLEMGMIADFNTLANAAEEAASRLQRPGARASVLGLRGALRRREGRTEDARALWEERLAIYESSGDLEGTVDAMMDLTAMALFTGQVARAEHTLSLAIRSLKSHHTYPVLLSTRIMAAQIFTAKADRPNALRYARRAYSLLHRLDLGAVAGSPCYHFVMLGRIYRQMNEEVVAEQLFAEAVRRGLETDRVYDIGYALLEMGALYERTERLERAVQIYAASTQLHEEIGSNMIGRSRQCLQRVLETCGPDIENDYVDMQSIPWRDIVLRVLAQIGQAQVASVM